MEERRFKEIRLNDPVTVTLPAWVWQAYHGAYMGTEWVSWYASRIADASQEAMLDPLFVKETQAQQQAEQDKAEGFMNRLMTGRRPEMPPNMEEGV